MSYFNNLEVIKNRCSSRRFKVTFLQVPYYSIARWNKSRHEKVQSKVIDRANAHIDRLDKETSQYTPRLNQDLVRSRKCKRGKQRYSLRLKLLNDVIYPGPRLARSWLVSIKRKINIDCA